MINYNVSKLNASFVLDKEDLRSKVLSIHNINNNIIIPFSYLKGEEDYVSIKLSIKYKNIDGEFLYKETLCESSMSTQIVMSEPYLNSMLVEKIIVEIYFNGSCEPKKFGIINVFAITTK